MPPADHSHLISAELPRTPGRRVADEGGAATVRLRDRDGHGGRWLRIVEALAAAWGVHPETTYVWAEIAV